MSSGRRTIFIGDVHGCSDELGDLVRATGATRDDRIVLVGDLVAKGPDSQAVVERAREMGALAVRGNHDEAVLRYRRAQRQGDTPPRLKPGHERVARTLREDDWRYLEALPLWLDFPALSVRVVHAGVVPERAMEAQREADLLTMRSLTADGSGSPRLEDGVRWATRYRGPPHVVFGHDAISGLQEEPSATGLDTGCVYGGALTALVVPDIVSNPHEPLRTRGRLVSVPARRVYREIPA